MIINLLIEHLRELSCNHVVTIKPFTFSVTKIGVLKSNETYYFPLKNHEYTVVWVGKNKLIKKWKIFPSYW